MFYYLTVNTYYLKIKVYTILEMIELEYLSCYIMKLQVLYFPSLLVFKTTIIVF